jgi:predicted RNA-binding protein YlxR (DUF448 family)
MQTPSTAPRRKKQQKGVRPKHVPQRTCVACRETDAKRSLTRIVRTPEHDVVIDPTGKRNGRGAYLCERRTCWERALSGNVLSRALNVELTADALQSLREFAASLPEASSDDPAEAAGTRESST